MQIKNNKNNLEKPNIPELKWEQNEELVELLLGARR